MGINKALIQKVFHEAAGNAGVLFKFEPEAVEQLVYHVAAHEVGHAIYNLRNVEKCLPFPSISLEEPRAELTAMFTLKMLQHILEAEMAPENDFVRAVLQLLP